MEGLLKEKEKYKMALYRQLINRELLAQFADNKASQVEKWEPRL